MVDLDAIAPGDVIHRCNVASFDEDVPLFVIACRRRKSDIVGACPILHVLGIYMVRSGNILLEDVYINELGSREYEWMFRARCTM